MPQPNYCAVIVTFNRQALLVRCLDALRSQQLPLHQIIVVDNASTDGTNELIAQRYPEVVYHRLPRNDGPAGAFAAGIIEARRQAADWIWLMDDDAWPLPDALKNIDAHVTDQPTAGVIAATCIDEPAPTPARQLQPIGDAMFVGYLLRAVVVDQVGLPNKDFIIYWDDISYTRRIKRAGFGVWRAADSLIVHQDWRQRETTTVRVLGIKKMQKEKIAPWRLYYLYRNRLLTMRADNEYTQLRWKTFNEYARTVVFHLLTGDLASAWAVWRGWYDGVWQHAGLRYPLPGSTTKP